MRAQLTAAEDGTLADPGKMTVSAWLPVAGRGTSCGRAKTLERYQEIVERHLIPALGAIALGKLQPVHIQSYYATALTSGRRDGTGGLSPEPSITMTASSRLR